jgi:2-isopropylmalate synthase
MTTNGRSKYQFSKSELRELLYDYNRQKGVLPEDRPRKVGIWDETLRDGEQTPGVFLTVDEKIKIVRKLDEIGTAKIAVGFPAVSPNELNTVKEINNLNLNQAKILGIARPRESDINACIDCGLDEIVIFMPISDLMIKILRETHESELIKIQKSFDYAKQHGLKFNWVAEDGTRAQPDHLLKVFQMAVDAKANCIVLGDTVGILQPETTVYLIEKIKKEINWKNSDTALGIHTHNDFGLAVANTIAAVFHGATLPHVCVNGYGERAGNAAFEEVVVNLEGMGIRTGIEVKKLTELSQLVEEIFSLPLSTHKPIVGSNAFSHESGLHINAIISHPISYEPINPRTVGQERRLYLGKFSGSGSIINALETKLKSSELHIPKDVIYKILSDVKQLHEESSKEEKHQLFLQTKALVQKLRSGISDREFFQIVQKYAKEYLKGTWAEVENTPS